VRLTMKNILKFSLAVLALLLGSFGASAQQNTLTQTTLSAAIAGAGIEGQGGASGTQPPAPILVQVASATGIVGLNPNLGITASQPSQTAIFVDQELMLVYAVNGTLLSVVRGQMGTQATPHASGAVVWIGKPYYFHKTDPSGSCTAAQIVASPWVNVFDARFFLCDATTGAWQPIFSTGSITPAATAGAIQTAAQTFTVNGLVSGEPIIVVSQPAPTSLCPLVAARVTAANTVSLYFTTLTAAACTPAAGTYYFNLPRLNSPTIRAVF
jgi:hypothetical protein